ncbi:MAG: glycosyltransferase [Reyranella sp.]|uniref:glycosyltransferase n=1 Tax=Reyranella sp. TaxID=1929291 RepID=UPI003D13DE32
MTAQSPDIPAASIVIPTLNEEKYLPVLLDSLMRVSAPMEIIVVDGASTDRTVQVVERYQPLFAGNASLRVLHSDARNISLQRNIGAAAAHHDLLIFCDADVRVPSHETYATLMTQFAEGRLAVAAPVLVPIEPGLGFKLAYKIVYWLQRLVLSYGRPYFAGSFLITTRPVFSRLGGFDPKILLAEDVDYSLRASKLGSYRLMNVRMGISARRLIKYGYWWIVESLPTIVRYIRTGAISPKDIHYPFGDYDKPRDG